MGSCVWISRSICVICVGFVMSVGLCVIRFCAWGIGAWEQEYMLRVTVADRRQEKSSRKAEVVTRKGKYKEDRSQSIQGEGDMPCSTGLLEGRHLCLLLFFKSRDAFVPGLRYPVRFYRSWVFFKLFVFTVRNSVLCLQGVQVDPFAGPVPVAVGGVQ